MNIGVTPMSVEQTIQYLRSLPAIRQRCNQVFDLAQQGELEYFEYHPEHEDSVVQFCVNIINRDFGANLNSIPPHGRWRHLDAGFPRVLPMIEEWNASPLPPDDKEICRRLIDLFLVSVLLDAGAGNFWKYTEPESGQVFTRSEGLGVASIHMFKAGFFSGDTKQPYRVDAEGLSRVTPQNTATHMQVTPSNPMTGIEGRATLLSNLAEALRNNSTYFGESARPGNLVDFLESQSKESGDTRRVHISVLWHVLVDGLSSIWPATRTTLAGGYNEGDDLVPFHKLTGWTTYSLLEPLQKILKWKIDGLEDLTGLPEYRNGGLLVDLGVLSLKRDVIPRTLYTDPSSDIPRLAPSHPAIIEWRAITVIMLDRIAEGIRRKLNMSAEQLSLAQVLESATWKGGREIAKQLRPGTGGPPIEIESDGTVF